MLPPTPISLPSQPKTHDPSLLKEIKEVEQKINVTEKELAQLNGVLQHLRTKLIENSNIKWRESIRGCLKGKNGKFYLCSHSDIIFCIETANSLKADKVLKNKIITTLSMMQKEGELNRIRINNQYYYGFKDIFSEEGVLKDKYSSLLESEE